MKRFSAAIAVLLAAACGGSATPTKATIQVFLAQPGLVSLGGSTQLVIAASPSNATLTIDNGVGDVTGKTTVTVSPADSTTYTLTAKIGGSSVTATTFVGVVAAPSTAYKVEQTSPALVVAGTPATYAITALDATGAVNANYRGKVHFTSDDASASLPGDVTFQAADAGKVSAAVTFKTAGAHSLVASDSVVSTAQGSARVVVSPAAAAALALTGIPGSATAGDRLAITVTALDAYHNVATGFAGTVHFSSADTSAQLPADYTFGAADKGVRAFSTSFTKAASTTISVAATGVTGASGSLAVRHAPTAKVTLEGVPSSVTVDTDVPVTVTVRDNFGNPITDYAGTLHFVLSDGSAAPLSDLAFTTAMQGAASVTVRFATAADQSIVATDTASSSITGTAATKVTHGSAAAYTLSALPAGAVAGSPLSLVITAVDAHGNVVKNYAGTAHVSSSDATDRLPADGGFTNGVRTVSLAFVKAGAHTATVAELGGTISANTTSVAVAAAAAASFIVTGGSTTAGVATSTTVTVKDAYGNTVTGYTGTVTVGTSDTQATPPAPYTFSSGAAGVHAFPITLLTAGAQTVTATGGGISASAGFAVSPAAAASLSLAGLPGSAVAGSRLAVTVAALDAYGNLATGFGGTVHFSSDDSTAALPADYAFVPADSGTHAFGAAFTKAATTMLSVSAPSLTGANGSVAVGHAAAARVTLEGVPSSVTVDTDVVATVTVRDSYGNPITDYAGTLHFVLTDSAAAPIPDQAFTPSMSGTADVTVRFATAGDQSIMATDTASSPITGSTATKVNHGSATAYTLSALPAGAVAGEPLPLSITAVDAHGNVVKNYGGTAHVSSADSTDRLPADGGFTSGVRTVSLAFVTAAAHTATVGELGGTIGATTSSVTVVPGDAKGFLVTGGSTTAGVATSTTVTVEDTYGNTVVAYAGTVTVGTSDGQVTPPAPYTFNGGSAGTHTFPITLLTAGAQTVTATGGGVSGSGGFTVAPATGTACVVIDAPASVAAGSQVGLRVVVKDAYTNVATGYAGTMAITSTDTSAQLGGNGTFTATDAGSHAFSVQLRMAGNQTITATDTVSSSITCSAPVTVAPGATVLVVTFLGLNTNLDAWAGTPVSATVTAQDSFANRISNYGGTVAFTSSDGAAAKPGNATFVSTDNGQKTVSVTFNSVGAQTFTATDTVTSAIQGASKPAAVHGLVYTNPATGGKVRLVQNAVSNASVVQLDLVSNTSLFALSAGPAESVRNGVFAAGLNLPLDTTKVGADTTLLVTAPPTGITAVLSLGTGTQAKGAAINTTNGVLYSGISQKRVDASVSGGLRADVSVRPYPTATSPGSYYYSLRLKLTSGAAVGTVFDGQALGLKFHAAVRDRSGSDVFSGPDFAIGKLEIR